MRTKKPLFQWDINQKFINCTGQYIDFIFDNDPEPYRVEIKDGTCLIPDEFLQTEGKKTVYECLSDGTITENKITIHGRPKPPSYVYTTTEKLTFDGLVQKVNTTIDDIISRANSGEFNGTSVTHIWDGTTLIITSASGTSSVDLKGEKGDTPKKGVDYYTENEIEGIIENITSGSIGKFKQTVEDETSTFNANSDNKLSAFNKNASDKTIELNNNANSKLEEYNINSENKLNSYNSNATNKIDEYNNNATDTITEFNNNALSKQNTFNENVSNIVNEFNTSVDTKISEYNSNAESKVTEYNQNDTNKTAEYNSNAKIKFDEYNTNADNRVAEFDSHTEQLQTDISELKNDLTGLQTVVDSKADKTELAKTNLYLDALYKLNKGQTYDVLEQESEAYSVDVPSGSRYVGVDKVGGKSIVWNQLINVVASSYQRTDITLNSNENGELIVNGETTSIVNANGFYKFSGFKKNHKYLLKGCPSGGSNDTYKLLYNSNGYSELGSGAIITCDGTNNQYKTTESYKPTICVNEGIVCDNLTFKLQLFDLTQMFGAGNEPSTVEEFEAMFPADYYEYCEPTIISSQTGRVEVRGRNLFNPVDKETPGTKLEVIGNTVRLTAKVDSTGTGVYLSVPTRISVEAGKTVFVSVGEIIKSKETLNAAVYVSVNDENGNQIGNFNDNRAYQLPTNAKYLDVYLYADAGSGTAVIGGYVEYHNVQVEYGSTATDYSPYSLQQIETGFPVLNSVGSVYDYVDLSTPYYIDNGKWLVAIKKGTKFYKVDGITEIDISDIHSNTLHQRVGKVDMGTLNWVQQVTSRFYALLSQKAAIKSSYNDYTNVMCANYESKTLNFIFDSNKGVSTHPLLAVNVWVYDSDYTDAESLKTALSGQILHYELAEEIVTDIEIPAELVDWLTVEAGGSITFHNADDGKRLLIPNKETFIRKLDEVTV